MSEFVTDMRLLEILQGNNFNQTASARFLANGDTDKFENLDIISNVVLIYVKSLTKQIINTMQKKDKKIRQTSPFN